MASPHKWGKQNGRFLTMELQVVWWCRWIPNGVVSGLEGILDIIESNLSTAPEKQTSTLCLSIPPERGNSLLSKAAIESKQLGTASHLSPLSYLIKGLCEMDIKPLRKVQRATHWACCWAVAQTTSNRQSEGCAQQPASSNWPPGPTERR